jgi:hypothetical protein
MSHRWRPVSRQPSPLGGASKTWHRGLPRQFSLAELFASVVEARGSVCNRSDGGASDGVHVIKIRYVPGPSRRGYPSSVRKT